MRSVKRNPADALILQLLEWIAARPHTYAEAIEVWRTSCPRLSIWEDACIAGLIDADEGRILCVSRKGRALLRARHRRHAGQADPGESAVPDLRDAER